MPKKRVTRASNRYLISLVAKNDPSDKRSATLPLPAPDPKRTKEAKDTVQEFIASQLEIIKKLCSRMN